MDTYSPSYSINKTSIYHVSKHSSSHYGSLIDRGANGGLAGSDVRILERTGRTLSVTGIEPWTTWPRHCYMCCPPPYQPWQSGSHHA